MRKVLYLKRILKLEIPKPCYRSIQLTIAVRQIKDQILRQNRGFRTLVEEAKSFACNM